MLSLSELVSIRKIIYYEYFQIYLYQLQVRK